MNAPVPTPVPSAAPTVAVIIRTLRLEKRYGAGDAATYALRGVDSAIHRG